MDKDEQQTPDTSGHPLETSQAPENSGRQRNFHHPQRGQSRDNGDRGHYQENKGSKPALEKPADSKEKETAFDEEGETEPDRSSPQQRHHRSGRPEKRIIEESINDPYCE